MLSRFVFKRTIMNKLSTLSRIIIAIGSLALIIVYFVPVWSIYLIAPQYPEGLSMQIWLDKITGQVEIINGLNHYIGMKHISADMFPEFTYLVYFLAFYVLFGLLVAITGSRKLLLAFLFLFVAGGIAALVDFYLWGALSPLIFYFAHRYPVGRERWLARTYETAAWADSRMTSPSWPVTVVRPLPGMRVASMNMISPPNCVQARPVVTPISGWRSANSCSYAGGPR